MEKRILQYLAYLTKMTSPESLADMAPDKRKELAQKSLIQIGLFQHERLVHLIVTVTFAILTILSVLANLFLTSLPLLLLTIFLLILLIPYIRHYYILENSVQKMYRCYDLLIDSWSEDM